MKKNSLAGILIIVLASCRNEGLMYEPSVGVNDRNIVTISCSVGEGITSRTQIQLGNQDESAEYMQWNEDDSISLYDLGADGITLTTETSTLYISSDYSDDSPSSSAFFSGESFITDGNTVVAFYPVQDTTAYDSTLTLSIPKITSVSDNSDDAIKEYMRNRYFMYGKSIFNGDDTKFSFKHLTSTARILYFNATDSSQTVSTVKISGDSTYFGTESTFSIVDTQTKLKSKATSIKLTFNDLTVAAGDSIDFYILFFPGDEFNADGTLNITINDLSVSLETTNVQSSSFTAGYRYKFKVTQIDDDELVWTTDYYNKEYLIIYNANNAALCKALANKLDDVKLDDIGNAYIPVTLLEETKSLDLSNCGLTTLSGLEHFTYLEELSCYKNSLTTLDATPFTKLKTLKCYNNSLTNLNLSGCTALNYLDCGSNSLTSLNLSTCTSLAYLICPNGGLTSIDLSGCTSLTYLDCISNALSTLDLTTCNSLKILNCVYNSLVSLDITNNPIGDDLYCGYQTGTNDDNPMLLHVTESQYETWESTWKFNGYNAFVKADDGNERDVDNEVTLDDYGNGGVF